MAGNRTDYSTTLRRVRREKVNTMTVETNKRWHLGRYSRLAWLETALKLVALGSAIVALSRVGGRGTFETPNGLALVQLGVLIILSLGLAAAIFDRIIEREIIAMAFVIVNNVGHWGMSIALLSTSRPDTELLVFAGLMLVADMIKLYMLVKTKFRVRDTPLSVMYGLTLFFICGYLLILLLEFAK